VFDALRGNRAGLATDRITPIMFRPRVTLLTDGRGEKLEAPVLTNTSDRDWRGRVRRAVVEAVDGPQVGIKPLAYL
jgi:hypothetical protein